MTSVGVPPANAKLSLNYLQIVILFFFFCFVFCFFVVVVVLQRLPYPSSDVCRFGNII